MFLKLFVQIFLVLTIVSSCRNSSDVKYNAEQDSSFISGSNCPPKKMSKLVNSKIEQVNFFMEVSGSMKHFMPSSSSSTDFQKLVPDLLLRLNTDYPVVNFYGLAQKNVAIKKSDINTVRDKIASGDFTFGESSELPVMFDSVITKLKPDAISILLTDAIYSPGNDRKKDQLISDIRSSIKKATDKGFSVTCYSSLSQFNKIESPYYYFVFGTYQNILDFKEKLSNTFNAVNNIIKNRVFNEINFGTPDLNPFYSIIPYVENTGAGEPVECPEWDNRYLAMENISIKNGLKFWVGLDLSKCPTYAQQSNYIKSNLLITDNGVKSNMVGGVLLKSQFISKIDDPTDRNLYNRCTHFISIELSEIADKKGSLSISLKKIEPSWISDFNHDKDKESESYREKTYGLSNIIAGIKDAYSEKENGFFFKGLEILISK